MQLPRKEMHPNGNRTTNGGRGAGFALHVTAGGTKVPFTGFPEAATIPSRIVLFAAGQLKQLIPETK
jgi:hypothetical protein